MTTIQKNFEVHDKFQFEMKLHYLLDHGLRDDYQVDMYLFLPNSLDLNNQSYPQESFYDDIKNHVRLKTPEFSLEQIASTQKKLPGQMLLDSVTDLKTNTSRQQRRLVEYHVKMVVSISLRAMHNEKELCLQDLKKCHFASSHELIVGIEKILGLIREIGPQIPADKNLRPQSNSENNQVNNPPYRLTTTVSSADEYLTSEATQILLKLLSAANTTATTPGPGLKDLREALLAAITKHANYRTQHGFPGILDQDQDHDETFLFRRGIFKKFFRSPLFLKQERTPEGQWAGQVAMGFAAGLSMIFATLIAFLAQQHFGNFTLPLFVALVVGYIFKDRIKELTKVYLDQWLSTRISDAKTNFYDQDKRRMGLCRETVRYVKGSQVPRNILELRNKDHLTEVANFWHAEQIIHYRKQVSLYRRQLDKTNSGYKTIAVNDIIRYNVGKLLRNMDEPEKELMTLGADGAVMPVIGSRIYKINLVLKLSGGAKEQFVRFRLILDRDGIRRLEEVKT